MPQISNKSTCFDEMKNNEEYIKNFKEYIKEERMRREREKQQFNAMINKYDQSLTMGERENQELKILLFLALDSII